MFPAVSIADGLILSLILLFLTVPAALLLLDRTRASSGRTAGKGGQPQGGADEGETGPAYMETPEPFAEVVQVESPPEITHDFDDVPPHGAYVPDYGRTEGEVDTGGLLHLGAATRHRGPVRVLGHLGLGHGAEVRGDVHVAGDLRLGPEARIEGDVTVQGDAHLGRRAEIAGELQARRTFLRTGAGVDGPVRSARVTHGPEAQAPQGLRGVYERPPVAPEAPAPADARDGGSPDEPTEPAVPTSENDPEAGTPEEVPP
jgi:hypothetical protein